MRIALVVYQFDETKGGVEGCVADLSRQMLSHDHEVHVYCAKRGRQVPSKIIFHQVPVTKFWSPLAVRSFARNSARMLQNASYDVVHGFSLTYCQDIYCIGGGSHAVYVRETHPWADTLFGRPLMALNPRYRAIIAVEKMQFSRGNYKRLTAVSEVTKREVVQEFNVPPEDITVIYNSVDATRFAPERLLPLRDDVRRRLGIFEDETAILFVGTGWQRKGLKTLLEAIQRLHSMKTKLIVVGHGDIKAYTKIAKGFGIGPQVIFTGRSSHVEEYYAAGDLFVLPSLHDPFGNVVLEAMASSLPVICSKTAGASEVISDGVDSLLIEDPRDAAALSDRITILLDPVKRGQIGARARITASAYPHAENYRQTMLVYDEVLRMKRIGDPRREVAETTA
jgi:UDP-glucose:(heptosyl)LPS alpha-1,3-glucosyltransferase